MTFILRPRLWFPYWSEGKDKKKEIENEEQIGSPVKRESRQYEGGKTTCGYKNGVRLLEIHFNKRYVKTRV